MDITHGILGVDGSGYSQQQQDQLQKHSKATAVLTIYL